MSFFSFSQYFPFSFITVFFPAPFFFQSVNPVFSERLSLLALLSLRIVLSLRKREGRPYFFFL